MDVQERLQAAVGAHQAGRLDEASAGYAAVLEAMPEQPDALHFSGLLAFQRGDAGEGIARIRRSLAAFPANAAAHNNLGNILRKEGRREEALESYSAALGIDKSHVDTWNNVGVLLRGVRRLDEAEEALQQAVKLNPGHAEAWHNLGLTRLLMGKLEDAAEALEHCLDLGVKSWSDPVWHARVLCALGRKERALRHLDDFLVSHPDHAVARHQRAALLGEEVDRASDGYVRDHFDSFAASFDDVLENLQYRAPEIVAGRVAELMAGRPKVGDCVDLGCGTGLCGPLIRQHVVTLVGVDLSPGMLRLAHERGGYDHLVEAELVTFLNEAPRDAFGLAVCVDTLCYFGKLEEMFAELRGALAPGGVMVATVERLADDEGPGYRIDESGRYAHRADYIAAAATGAGLELVDIRDEVLRRELGRDVAGHVFTVLRPAA